MFASPGLRPHLTQQSTHSRFERGERIDYKGFEIWVLPILAYGPPTPDTPYHYNGYVCRPGADLRHAGQRTQFYELGNVFDTEAKALDAAYHAGRDLVDKLIEKG